MDNESPRVYDGQTEAIVLHHIKESDKAVQTVAEAATKLGALNGGRYPVTVTSIMLTHLRSCLTELVGVYAERDIPRAKGMAAAAAVFEVVIQSMSKRRAVILRNNTESRQSTIEFDETAAIYRAEALQKLETALAAKPTKVHPYVEKIAIPIIAAIVGAVAGSIGTYIATHP